MKIIEFKKEDLEQAVRVCGGSDKKLGDRIDRTARQIRNYRAQGKAPLAIVNEIIALAHNTIADPNDTQ